MKENFSPEERLLKLIRQGKPAKSPLAPAMPLNRDAGAAKPATAVERTTLPQAKSAIPDQRLQKVFHLLRRVNVNAAARGLLALSLVLFFSSLGYSFFGSRTVRLPKMVKDKIREEDYSIKNNLLPFDQYAQVIKQRKVFNALSSGSGDQAIIAADANMVKDLNLLGIIGDAVPQAIIEDKKTHDTYYVEKGKTFGDMQVEDIQEGKVIIQYEGERYELSL